jgi:hypothetical protein
MPPPEFNPPPSPPELSYSSANTAITAMQDFAKNHGYAMILKRLKPDKAVVKIRHYFYCNRHKIYTSQATVHNSGSRATGCPFCINIYQIEKEWKLEVIQEIHNHEPSHSAASHEVH